MITPNDVHPGRKTADETKVAEVFKEVLPECGIVPIRILKSEKGTISFVDKKERSMRFTLVSDAENPDRAVWSIMSFGYARKNGDRYLGEV